MKKKIPPKTKFKISPETITKRCPKCGSEKIVGIYRETMDPQTGKIAMEDKTVKFFCLGCGHKFWRKRHKFKVNKENLS